MNRKGQETNAGFDLTYPEIIQLIIVALGILLLAGFIYKWYNQQNSADLEKATAISEAIIARINAVEENKTLNLSSMQGFISNDEWIIAGWGKNDPARPEKCFLESCIIICKKDSGDLKVDCEKAGIKQKVMQENVRVITENEVFQKAGNTEIDTGQKAETNYIKIPKNLFQLEITKTKDSLLIKSYGKITIESEGFRDNIH